MKALQEFGRLTIISVTHHLHTLEYCDMVVHLKSGGRIDHIEWLRPASNGYRSPAQGFGFKVQLCWLSHRRESSKSKSSWTSKP